MRQSLLTIALFAFLGGSSCLFGCGASQPDPEEIHQDARSQSWIERWALNQRPLEACGEKHACSGKASWYGPGFHGRTTANGESYDMYGISAAHKTLPFGTLVVVKRPDTRQEVIVRINDRGPYAKGRVIDLSYGAAHDLGMLQAGVVKVELQVLAWGDGKGNPKSLASRAVASQ